MTTVLIVDDLSSIREFLKFELSSEPDLEIVGLADNGEQAIAQVKEHQPDVVLMDIDMPGRIDGIKATEKIIQYFSQTKVLLLTSKDNREQLNLALQVGARGYILKNTSVRDIADIVRLTQKGFFQIGPIFSNWNGSLHENLQSNNSWQIGSTQPAVGAGAMVQQGESDVSEMNFVISNLTSGIFQLQETIEAQKDTIVNLTNQYSQVQQEIKTKLKRDRNSFNIPRGKNYIARSAPKTRSQRQQQHFLLISSFLLGVFTVSILIILIMTLGGNI